MASGKNPVKVCTELRMQVYSEQCAENKMKEETSQSMRNDIKMVAEKTSDCR